MKPGVTTYGMAQRSDRPDFYIRDQRGRAALTEPHRHDYFQIQVNLGGDTVQHIGGAVRPFPKGGLAFILPHRLHLIPHPPHSQFLLVNFSQRFLLPQLACDPLDLEDLAIEQWPELAPFRFQEHLDFIFDGPSFAAVCAVLARLQVLDQSRGFGAELQLRGGLLQLLGLVCERFASALAEQAAGDSVRQGRRDAIGRVRQFIAGQLHEPGLDLKAVAAGAFLSLNYLTHLLRKETGKSFSLYLAEQRLQLARTLLLGSTQPVGQVAAACGFADESYFARCFRKHEGMAPSHFRRHQGHRSVLPGDQKP